MCNRISVSIFFLLFCSLFLCASCSMKNGSNRNAGNNRNYVSNRADVSITSVSSGDIDYEDDIDYMSLYTRGCTEIYDPFERFNRFSFYLNGTLDILFIKPLAKTYHYIVPKPIQKITGNALSNLKEPLTTVNFVLQGRFKNALRSVMRFVINSTLGLGGMVDVASKMNLKPNHQTFGNVLAHYGVGPGPYFVVPLLGNFTTIRHVGDNLIPINRAMNPLGYYLNSDIKRIKSYASIIHGRAEGFKFEKNMKGVVIDPYVAIRSMTISQIEGKAPYKKGFICPKL